MRTSLFRLFVGVFSISCFWQLAHAESNCLDASVVAEIRAKVKLKTKDVSSFDLCKPESQTYKILQALTLLKTLTFADTALAKPFNQNILPKDFWAYFSDRVGQITDEATCDNDFLAFVHGGSKDREVHICPSFYGEVISRDERAMAMLHEARHFEGFVHVTCLHGPRKGEKGACDKSIGQKGSYAVTVESLTKLALNSREISKVNRVMNKLSALSYASEAFNKSVQAEESTALLLVDQNDNAFLYNDQGASPVASLGDARVISRGSVLAVFPLDRSDAFSANAFSPALDALPAEGAFSLAYNQKPIAERPRAIDILNLTYLSGGVTETEASVRLMNEQSDTVVKFPFKATSVFSGREFGKPDKDSLYILGDDQQSYRLQLLKKGKFKLGQVRNRLGNVEQVSIFNGKRLGRDRSGEILIEEQGQWKSFVPLSFGRFKQMTRPFAWDQYFEELDSMAASPAM